MYHIGLIQHIITPGKGVASSDGSVQAVVRMWDANLILGVDDKIGRKVKKNDYVIADYTPLSPDSGNRKLTIIKVLPHQEGSLIWADFQDEFNRRASFQQMR